MADPGGVYGCKIEGVCMSAPLIFGTSSTAHPPFSPLRLMHCSPLRFILPILGSYLYSKSSSWLHHLAPIPRPLLRIQISTVWSEVFELGFEISASIDE